MESTLLVELLTEELPPKSLARLSTAFRDLLVADLMQNGFLSSDSAARALATPRRLAVTISHVRDAAPDSEVLVKGPSVKAGLDSGGKSTAALLGFAKKRGVPVERLIRVSDGKQEVFAHRDFVKGGLLETSLDVAVDAALKKLPISKVMRWGDRDTEFVRPVHGIVMLHGSRAVPGRVLGLESGNRTRGHRFMSNGEIMLSSADEYETRLRDEGRVIADFAERRAEIERLLKTEAARLGAALGAFEDLLDEVTALVEHATVYVGEFPREFLEVPQECLILTMKQNQKYFPLFDAGGKLLPKFLIVSNMKVDDPCNIVEGNERVVRPRLEDARFFYNQDCKVRLEARVPQLGKVVYHNKLGSQLERVERIQLLAGTIARGMGADPVLAERAAWLAKADLLTGMVGEFPELQGVMGRYYALHDGEPREAADAIEAHYRPRFAGDRLPESKVACAVALADKLDTLAGMFGIGQQPSGDKDPFGLRRAALGVLRILVEQSHALSLHDLVNAAFEGYNKRVGAAHTDLEMFIFDRFAGYLKERGYAALEVDAVLSLNPARVDLVPRQLEAVRTFLTLPEADSLAAANKRVVNILKQAAAKGETFIHADAAKLKEPAERALFDALKTTSSQAITRFDQGDFTGYLKAFAVLKSPVDAFFDSVMVMADEPELRQNRLALLAELRAEMNRVADISKLAA
ncbi:MAG: glycine--tRNA ligase subunit beta [Betaproteobacteria bacterium]|nr:glycine--tRNA ligase subunit beta [Betaproteobacteria bacterium]